MKQGFIIIVLIGLFFPILGQNPMQIIINTELAGDWMTDNPINSTTIFPNYMYIDQANVYKLKYECDTVVNEILNYNRFNYAVKKSITLSSVSSLFSGENVFLRATENWNRVLKFRWEQNYIWILTRVNRKTGKV